MSGNLSFLDDLTEQPRVYHGRPLDCTLPELRKIVNSRLVKGNRGRDNKGHQPVIRYAPPSERTTAGDLEIECVPSMADKIRALPLWLYFFCHRVQVVATESK